MIIPLILIGKIIRFISKSLNLGNGGTWPGEIALTFNDRILEHFVSQVEKGVIIVAGTNGKTTTSLMIRKFLEKSGKDVKVVHNQSGANIENGLVSAFISQSSAKGRIYAKWAVLEVDENVLPVVLPKINRCLDAKKKIIVVLLNLFRDQLDRYGEVDLIARKWQNVLAHQSKKENTTLILNADDPLVAYIGGKTKARSIYFGLDKPEVYLKTYEHATDSIYCPSCGQKLDYEGVYFSHLGKWSCKNCGLHRPAVKSDVLTFPLAGIYNLYNSQAAYWAAIEAGVGTDILKSVAVSDFMPAFGRQEEIEYKGKKIKIFLAKNPAGFNAALRTVIDLRLHNILLVLNDRIPDGRDVSWIWDVDFEMIPGKVQITVSGDRAYDVGLRIKYTSEKVQTANIKCQIEENLERAINSSTARTAKSDVLYVFATYSAMLEVRKILTGRKIL
ncbi:MurT ligase domain-containing protein [Patescibacteria group bacterium]|nr:MurT ligase domain-containing protein [Patescibacteria group bacterium]